MIAVCSVLVFFAIDCRDLYKTRLTRIYHIIFMYRPTYTYSAVYVQCISFGVNLLGQSS